MNCKGFWGQHICGCNPMRNRGSSGALVPPLCVCSTRSPETVKCHHPCLAPEEQSPVKGYVQANWDQYQAQILWKPLFLGPGGRWATWDAPWVRLVFARGWDVLRPTNLPAHEGPGCSLSNAWLHAPQIMARPSRTAQTSPAGSWNCGVPSHEPSDGGKSLFVCISVMTFSQETSKTDCPWLVIRGFTLVHNIFKIWGRNRVCTLSGWKLWIYYSYFYECWTINFTC